MENYKGIFWKVVTGFGITACLLAIAYWITYDNLSTLKHNLNTLTELNPKYVYRNKVIKRIDETESYIKKYTLNKNGMLLYQSDSCVTDIAFNMKVLDSLASDNLIYSEDLKKLDYYINRKLSVARQRVELADAFSTGKELSAVIARISEPEKRDIMPVAETQEPKKEKEPEEKRNFFSRIFSPKKNKKKTNADTTSIPKAAVAIKPPPADTFSVTKVKVMLQAAEQRESAKSTEYLKENLLLIDRDDRIHDSIRSVSASLEKLEIAESVKKINKLTDEATNRTGNILSSLILLGLLAMLLFIIVVYREVRFNERLRKELIAEKKSTEKLAKAKEEFLANMSHEIRTPMNVIMGFSDQLLKTGLTGQQQSFLLNIKRSSTHLTTVINEILDYSKMESGAITLENIAFEVEEVIGDVHVSFKGMAEKKDVVLGYNIDPAVSKRIMGDPVRLKQILLNLAGNAIKFTEKGSVHIHCKLWSSEEGTQTLLFEVQDTGIGIPEESHKSIFEQFTQADSSVTRKYGGTGLGLTISKRLVELHNGKIAVKSEPGKGSVFYFMINYDLPPAENDEQQFQSKEVKNTGLLRGKRILIADDDEMNKFLAQHILETYEVDVDTANNGKEALEKIINEYYDIVLMDLHMPEIGGIDVVSRVRKKGIDVPVIAITGNVLKSEKEKCIAVGMNEYISKPYDETELLQKIIDLLPTV